MRNAILSLLVDRKWWNTRQIRTRVTGRNTRISEALLMMTMEGIISVRQIGNEKQFKKSEIDNAQDIK
jgi:hypothetical protein